MVGLDEAEALTGMSGQALRDRDQAGGWHVCESQHGVRLICLESLLKKRLWPGSDKRLDFQKK